MNVIPEYISNKTSNAELKVFDLFRQIKSGKESVVIHSVNLPEHAYKRWGEIDFMLISHRGILVLEIKGGGVQRNNGIWNYTDRYGVIHKSSEGPINQAKSAMFALKKRLKSNLSGINFNQITFGFGVVFPDTKWQDGKFEVPDNLICDFNNTKNSDVFKKYISRLFDYWIEQDTKKSRVLTNVSSRNIDDIVKDIRHDFDLIPTLKSRVDQISKNRVSLTKQQYNIIDSVKKSKRILCIGGAGTGKTFIAIELAKRESTRSGKILFVCKSRTLVEFIKLQLKDFQVVVLSIDDAKDLIDKHIKFDMLIVDEGQDLLNMENIDSLELLLINGIDKGVWRWFMDLNNQSGVETIVDLDALEIIESAHPVSMELNLNCRNTEEVVLQTQLVTGSDIGRAQVKGSGLEVQYVKVLSQTDAKKKLIENLTLWSKEVEQLNDIVILSPVDFKDSIASEIPDKWLRLIQVLNSQNIINQDNNKILFSTIKGFKGLEKGFVCIVDTDILMTLPDIQSNIYVGMTRANSVLCIQSSAEYTQYIENQKKINIFSLVNNGTE